MFKTIKEMPKLTRWIPDDIEEFVIFKCRCDNGTVAVVFFFLKDCIF